MIVKNEVLHLSDILQKNTDTWNYAFGIRPLFCYSTLSLNWKPVLINIGVEVYFITDGKLTKKVKKNCMRTDTSLVMGNRYVKQKRMRKIQQGDKIFYTGKVRNK